MALTKIKISLSANEIIATIKSGVKPTKRFTATAVKMPLIIADINNLEAPVFNKNFLGLTINPLFSSSYSPLYNWARDTLAYLTLMKSIFSSIYSGRIKDSRCLILFSNLWFLHKSNLFNFICPFIRLIFSLNLIIFLLFFLIHALFLFSRLKYTIKSEKSTSTAVVNSFKVFSFVLYSSLSSFFDSK